MADANDIPSNTKAILKDYYASVDLPTLLMRLSPILGLIKIIQGGGKSYVYPMGVSAGGIVTGDFTMLANMAALAGNNVTVSIPYGQIFSAYFVGQKENFQSEDKQGAFVNDVIWRAHYAMFSIKRMLAAAFYGAGYGDVGPVEAVDSSLLYVDVKEWVTSAIDINSQIVFATQAWNGALRSGTAVTVSSITQNADGTFRVTFASAINSGVIPGDWLLVYGFKRTSDGNPILSPGLRQWIPSLYGRSGSSWTSYIGTAFNGIDRSAYVNRLAGGFTGRIDSTEKYSTAILRLLRQLRRQGSKVDRIAMNDVDMAVLIAELDAYKQYFQAINGPDKGTELEVTHGISALSFAFSSSWIQYVTDDPYCPEGVGYLLELDSWNIVMLNNSSPFTEAMPVTNEPGAPKVNDTTKASGEVFTYNADNLFAITPANTQNGPGAQVSVMCYYALACYYPAHNGAVRFNLTDQW